MTNTETMQQAITEIQDLLNTALYGMERCASADWDAFPEERDGYCICRGACGAYKEALSILMRAAGDIKG